MYLLERWRKIELVEEQTGNIDPKANFRLIIIQTELERFKFLVRSYLRARIAKVGSAIIFACTRGSTDGFSPRSTNTPSTSSPTRRRNPVSRLRKSNTLPRINLCFTRTTTRLSSRNSLLLCRDWTIRRGGSVWLSSRMWMKRCL